MTQRSVRVRNGLPEWAAGLYAAMDTGDTEAVVGQLSVNARMRFGNADPVVGHAAIRAVSRQFLGSLAGMSHTFHEVWESGDSALMVCDVTYTRLDGSTVCLPAATFVHHQPDGLIDDIQVFQDMAPIFAAGDAV